MFICNFRLKSKQLLKIFTITLMITVITLFILATYRIVHDLLGNKICDNCEIPSPEVASIKPENYTNILKEVHENVDEYIGQKISFTGYVYRVNDLKDDEFILARDMLINNKNQTVVVGFLCKYKDASQFEDKTWIKISGEIQKGYYYGDIPCIEINTIEKCSEPSDPIVGVPDENYIPTSTIY